LLHARLRILEDVHHDLECGGRRNVDVLDKEHSNECDLFWRFCRSVEISES
jgi:hypothetical protein